MRLAVLPFVLALGCGTAAAPAPVPASSCPDPAFGKAVADWARTHRWPSGAAPSFVRWGEARRFGEEKRKAFLAVGWEHWSPTFRGRTDAAPGLAGAVEGVFKQWRPRQADGKPHGWTPIGGQSAEAMEDIHLLFLVSHQDGKVADFVEVHPWSKMGSAVGWDDWPHGYK